jgi:hypothetical protein
MQCVKPIAKGWGKPNKVNNAKEKTYEGKWKHGMIGRVDSQAFTPGLAQDFKCESEDMSKMMLGKDWL